MTIDRAHERIRDLDSHCATGQYRYDLVRETWWWSSAMYALHGFAPGEVVPTTALVLAHKHPDDHDRVAQVLAAAKVSGAPFSSVHRIMTARGRERTVVVTGQGRKDSTTGKVVELLGFAVDVSAYVEQRTAERANQQVRAATSHRAAIEQAKGMIGLVERVDEDAAFARLRKASNDLNVPVRELAGRVVATLGALPPDADLRTELAALLAPGDAGPLTLAS